MGRFFAIARLLLATGLAVASPAAAFELSDGRLQVNGFYEQQIRGIARNWDAGDGWDLAQWQHILNVEVGWEIAPDGIGPLDLVSSFVRIEARYDCIWTRGCRIFDSVDTYGDHPRRFPKRYSDGRSSGLTGAVETGDRRLRHGISISQLGFHFKDVPPSRTATPAFLWHVPGVSTLFGVPGPDGVPGNADDPAFYVFERFVDPEEPYRFGLRRVKGAEDGSEFQTLGPWSPRNTIEPIAARADRANPFDPLDIHPIFGTPESGAMPYRPAPAIMAASTDPLGRSNEPRGLFIPNRAVSKLLAANFDQVEPNDLGRCGEPYTPFPVCNKSAGLFAHGVAGLGLAGEVRPPHAW